MWENGYCLFSSLRPKWLRKAEFYSEDNSTAYDVVVRAFIREWTFNSPGGIFTSHGIVTSEWQHRMCKHPLSLWTLTPVNIYSTRWSGEAEKLRGKSAMWISIIILICEVQDWDMVQIVSAVPFWITAKIRLMRWLQYVCNSLVPEWLDINKCLSRAKQ